MLSSAEVEKIIRALGFTRALKNYLDLYSVFGRAIAFATWVKICVLVLAFPHKVQGPTIVLPQSEIGEVVLS